MLEQMIIAMAVFLTLFYAELTESSSSCVPHQVEIKKVDTNETAFVSCPALGKHEKTSISLHKEDTKLHPTNLSDVDSKQSRFQVSVQNSSVSFKIQRTKASDTGLYICKIDRQTGSAESRTLLVITDPLQSTEITVPCDLHMTVLLLVGCGVSIIYDLFITFFVCYLRRKLKNKEQPENPYINTRPIGFQRRR